MSEVFCLPVSKAGRRPELGNIVHDELMLYVDDPQRFEWFKRAARYLPGLLAWRVSGWIPRRYLPRFRPLSEADAVAELEWQDKQSRKGSA